MLVATAASFSSAIETGDGLALHVEDLALAVNSEASIGVVPDRTDRGGVKRRLLDLVHRCVLAAPEVGVGARVHVRVPLAHRLRGWRAAPAGTRGPSGFSAPAPRWCRR